MANLQGSAGDRRPYADQSAYCGAPQYAWSLDILGSGGEDHLRIIAGAVVNGGEMRPFVPLLA
jgi:hypothetical protein